MPFQALVVDPTAQPTASVLHCDDEMLVGGVLLKVEYSSCNFKDAMVIQPGNRIARRSPLIGGVDLAGTVLDPGSSGRSIGDPVVVHGYDLGVAHHGGFAERARVNDEWIVALPDGLSTRQSMILGTAGFTAFASLEALRHHGVHPSNGPILVTGATGGVGSFAVALAAAAGYEVVASSGKTESHDYLRSLGASEIVGRAGFDDRPDRVLGSERWAGAIDCVGGTTLPAILRSLKYGGCVAASGLTGGAQLETTVYPFITRGIALVGIDVVQMPMAVRQALWGRIANEVDLNALEGLIAEEVQLNGVAEALGRLHRSEVTGRILVRL